MESQKQNKSGHNSFRGKQYKPKQQQQGGKPKQQQQGGKPKQQQQNPKQQQQKPKQQPKPQQQKPKPQPKQQPKQQQQNINIPKKEVVSEPKIYEILEEEEPKKVIQPPKQETSFRSFFDTLSDLLNDEVVEETKENSISETSSDFVIISCKKKWKKVLVRIVVKYEEKVDFELHKKNPKEGRDSNIINFKGKKSRVKKIKRKILEILNE